MFLWSTPEFSPAVCDLPPLFQAREDLVLLSWGRKRGFSGSRVPWGRLLEVEKEVSDLPGIPHGETGESRPSSVDFQVLSWRPRALYFHQFATQEECQKIIKFARPSLQPSELVLREGETVESTKGVRTSSGTFISASEDSTGILDKIEQKISRVTTIPRENMEVSLCDGF